MDVLSNDKWKRGLIIGISVHSNLNRLLRTVPCCFVYDVIAQTCTKYGIKECDLDR